VQMRLVAGGVWAKQAVYLPVGTWPVTFHIDVPIRTDAGPYTIDLVGRTLSGTASISMHPDVRGLCPIHAWGHKMNAGSIWAGHKDANGL
jgi:hypothetical protein